MGNAWIWYTPDRGTIVGIDLGEGLSDMFWEPDRESDTGTTITGRQTRALSLGRLRVFVNLDRMAGGRDLAFKLRTLQSHLERGGRCAVSADVDKSFAAFVTSRVAAGNPRVDWAFQPWGPMVGGAKNLSAGDHVVVQSPSPEAYREFLKIHTWDAARRIASFAPGGYIGGTPRLSPVLVRWPYFFPSLVMPQEAVGRAIVNGEHELTFTLDLELVEDWGALAADAQYAEDAGVGWATDTDFGAFLVDQDGDRYIPYEDQSDPWADTA